MTASRQTGSNETTLRFVIFSLACVVIFAAITGLRLYAVAPGQPHPWWDEPLRDIAMAFAPLAICLVGWEFWLRKPRHAEVKELLDTEIKQVLEKRFERIDALERSGILQVHDEYGPNELRKFLERAHKRIRVLVPFFIEPLTLMPMLEAKLADPAFTLSITLLDPKSPYLEKRGQVVNPTMAHFGPGKATETINLLKASIAKAKTSHREVMTYDSLPSVFIAQADDRALLGFLLTAGNALKHPHLEIQAEIDGHATVLGKMLDLEFEKVRAVSTKIL